jgi:hypothetical protein
MQQKEDEKNDGLLGSVFEGVLGFLGIQSEEQKKAELIQKGTELQNIQKITTALYITICQLKNQETELKEKANLIQTQREKKQRQAYVKANKKRIIILKFIIYTILFTVSFTASLLLFKIITINNISNEIFFVFLIFCFFVLILIAKLSKEKVFYIEPSNEEKQTLRETQEVHTLLLNKEKEIATSQDKFLKEQENFLEKLEQISPEMAEALIQEVLNTSLKNIFSKDNLSSINLAYLKEKRLSLKEKRLQKEQERRLQREQERHLQKEQEKLKKEQEKQLKKQNSYQQVKDYSSSSWSWREQEKQLKKQNSRQQIKDYSNSSWSWENNKEINVKGYHKKDGTYVKPHKRHK